jgi:hypothetical protein
LAALVLTASASPQSVGRLFFNNANTGDHLIADVDQLGHFHPIYWARVSDFVGRNVLVPTADGILAYYVGGGGNIIQLDGRGQPRFGADLTLSYSWQQIVGLGSYLFFYDGQHSGAVVAVNPDGTTSQTDSRTNLSPWWQIVATDNFRVINPKDFRVLT